MNKECEIANRLISQNVEKRTSLVEKVVVPGFDRAAWAVKDTDKQSQVGTFGANALRRFYPADVTKQLNIPAGEAGAGQNLPSFQQAGRNANSLAQNDMTQLALGAVQTSSVLDNLAVTSLKSGACAVALKSARTSDSLLSKALAASTESKK